MQIRYKIGVNILKRLIDDLSKKGIQNTFIEPILGNMVNKVQRGEKDDTWLIGQAKIIDKEVRKIHDL